MSAFEFIAKEKASSNEFSVEAMCAALHVSRGGFYAFAKRTPSERAKRKAILESRVSAIFIKSRRRYGSRKVTRVLRTQGEAVAEKTVVKIMAKKIPSRATKEAI